MYYDLYFYWQMEKHEVGALQHVVDRYQQYSTDDAYIAAFSAPLLEAILNSLKEEQHVSNAAPALTIFSCHDTNIIGLLYCLRELGIQTGFESRCVGHDNLQSETSPNVISWPGFGTLLKMLLLLI